MKHVNFNDVEAVDPEEEDVKDIKVRWLITKDDGAKNFAMRMFEILPGGHTPWHQHDWEHEVFILEGEGTAKSKDGESEFSVGDVFFIPPNEWHQLKNTGTELLRLLCLIPYKD